MIGIGFNDMQELPNCVFHFGENVCGFFISEM